VCSSIGSINSIRRSMPYLVGSSAGSCGSSSERHVSYPLYGVLCALSNEQLMLIVQHSMAQDIAGGRWGGRLFAVLRVACVPFQPHKQGTAHGF
jgi:hypothetical protein